VVVQLLTLAGIVATAAAQASDPRSTQAAPLAQGNMAVVAFGRCEDARLSQAARDLRGQLRQQRGTTVLSEDDTARPAGGLVHSSLDEIRKAIQAGREQFFSLDYETAQATIRRILPAIDRLPPGFDRWEVAERARIELAHFAFFDDKRAQTEEIFSELLRLDESLKLDRHLYPPLLHLTLEEVRRGVREAKRFRLRVASKSPNYLLYLNGKEMGKTPFESSLVEGRYDIVVGDPAAHSFVRRVELSSDRDVEADVAREARFKAGAGPCYETDGSREERQAAAALVAGALSVEAITTVRFEKAGGVDYVVAAVFEAAQAREVREGRQRMEGGRVPSLRKPATFVVTGDSALIERPRPDGSAKAESEREGRSVPWLRAGAIALGAAAVGLGVAALVENGEAGRAYGDYERHAGDAGLSPAGVEKASALMGEYEAAKRLRNAFAIGAGVAAVASGTVLVISIASGHPGGAGARASVAVAGSFP